MKPVSSNPLPGCFHAAPARVWRRQAAHRRLAFETGRMRKRRTLLFFGIICLALIAGFKPALAAGDTVINAAPATAAVTHAAAPEASLNLCNLHCGLHENQPRQPCFTGFPQFAEWYGSG